MNVIIDGEVFRHPALQQAALRQFVKENGAVEGYAVIEEQDRWWVAQGRADGIFYAEVITTPDRQFSWYASGPAWWLEEVGVPSHKAREAAKKYNSLEEAADRKWGYQKEAKQALEGYLDSITCSIVNRPQWTPCPYTPPTTYTDRFYNVNKGYTQPYTDPIALDFETVGDYPFMTPISFSFSGRPGEALYVSIASDVVENESEQAWRSVLKQIVSGPWVAHNARFEMHCLETLGVPYSLPHDTMILNYLASEPRGLKESSLKLLGEKMQTFEEASKGRPWNLVPIEDGLDYACSDADMTLRLFNLHTGQQYDNDLYGQERALLPALAAMERRGITVDDDGLIRWERELIDQIASIEDKYQDINLASGQQVSRLLFNAGIMDPIKFTAKAGVYSTDDETLRYLSEQYEEPPPVLYDLMRHREVSKLRGTYAKGLRDHAKKFGDGRIHPQYDGIGTKTGRLSSKSPNGQNIPSTARKYLIASPGMKLFAADYSQIELRIIAHLSQDPVMLQTFRDGISPHMVTLKGIFGYDSKDENPRAYTLSKNINFGVPYGTSADTLVRVAREGGVRLSVEEASGFIEKHKALYPYFWAWRAEMVQHIRNAGGWATDMDGHTAYYPDILSDDPSLRGAAEREAVNKLIQGPAGRGAKRVMVRWYRTPSRAERFPLLANVHDEIVGEAPKQEADVALGLLMAAMRESFSLSIPVEVEGKTAYSWDQLK